MTAEVRKHSDIPLSELLEPKEDDRCLALSFICAIPGGGGCGTVKSVLNMRTGHVVDGKKVFWLDTGDLTPQQIFDKGGKSRQDLGVRVAEGHIAIHHPKAKTFDVIE